MQEICINRLDIKGSENSVKTFLKDFHSEEKGFTMSCIVPYNYSQTDSWRHSNWGTINDIFECSSYQEVMGTYLENNGEVKLSMNYLTVQVPNEVFCKKASKLYPDIKFTLYYYEPIQLFTGKTSYFKGLESMQNTIYIEKDEVNKNNSIIDVYEFAIKHKLTTLEELEVPLSRAPKNVRNHFYDKMEENNIIIDFNTLKEEYLSENIIIPKGDE